MKRSTELNSLLGVALILVFVCVFAINCNDNPNKLDKDYGGNRNPSSEQTDAEDRFTNEYGVLYGHGFAFGFKAPNGWVLDTKSARDQGLDAVFYPKGQTWTNSPVMAYARSYSKDEVKTASELAQRTIKDLHDNQSPNSKAIEVKPIQINDKLSAKVFYLTGDKWGNYEAIAYIEEKYSINYFVLNSRDEEVFKKSLAAFEELVKSYGLKEDSNVKQKNEGRNFE